MAVALVGTLDTKGREYAFLRGRLAAQGVEPIAIDAGVHEPVGVVGFFGASSMERLPTEVAMTENMRRFKAIPVDKGG